LQANLSRKGITQMTSPVSQLSTSPETERDAALVRDLALAFAAGRYEGGETLFDMYANIALKFMETRGLAQTPAVPTIMRKALEEICAGPLNTGAIYRDIALGALDQIAALSDTSVSSTRTPKVRTSHHRNKEEAARLQELVDKRVAVSHSSTVRNSDSQLSTSPVTESVEGLRRDIAAIIADGVGGDISSDTIATDIMLYLDLRSALAKPGLAQRPAVPVAFRVKFKGDTGWTLYYSDPRKDLPGERGWLESVEPLFTLTDTSTVRNSDPQLRTSPVTEIDEIMKAFGVATTQTPISHERRREAIHEVYSYLEQLKTGKEVTK
jgi:hypothetical protein